MDDRFRQTAIVRKLTSRGATLEIAGQTLEWPADRLPNGLKEGEAVSIRLLTKSAETAERHERARTILTEILGGNP